MTDFSWKELALRNRVLDSAEELLSDRTFTQLSVSDICEKAEISRQTFYRYFKDKYGILQWHFTHVVGVPLFQVGRTLNWYDATLGAINEILKHKTFYMAAYKENRGYQSISAYGHREVRENITKTITDYKGVPLTNSLEFQIKFFAEGTLNVFTNWGRKGMHIPPEEFATYLCECVPHELFNLLNKPTSTDIDDISQEEI